MVDRQNCQLQELKGNIKDQEQLKQKYDCLLNEVNHLKTVECQKTELEEERNKLAGQVQQLFERCACLEAEKKMQEKTLIQQQVCKYFLESLYKVD